MSLQPLPGTQESAPRLPGTWKLGAGRAITLRVREHGVVRIAHGRVWATFDGPHGASPDTSGDRVIGTGEQLRLRPGQRLVMEPWDAALPAYFSWDPRPAPQPQAVPRMAALTQPLADLRLALGLGLGALGRLLLGLAGLALGAPASRRARAPCPQC